MIVRGDDGGETGGAHQLIERAEDVVRGVDVEIAGRLVGEQDARRIGDRARDRDALLFAAREFRRPMRQPLLKTEIAQQFGCRARSPPGATGRGSFAAGPRFRARRIPAADDGTDRRNRSRCAGSGCAQCRSGSTSRRRRYRPRPRPDVRAGRRCAAASICRRRTAPTSATDCPRHTASSAPLRISSVESP